MTSPYLIYPRSRIPAYVLLLCLGGDAEITNYGESLRVWGKEKAVQYAGENIPMIMANIRDVEFLMRYRCAAMGVH